MILEYPVVALGAARIRLQVMATHSAEDAKSVARTIAEVVAEVAQIQAKRASFPFFQTGLDGMIITHLVFRVSSAIVEWPRL